MKKKIPMNVNSSKLLKQQVPGVSLGDVEAATVDLGSAMSLEIVSGSYLQVTKWGFISALEFRKLYD